MTDTPPASQPRRRNWAAAGFWSVIVVLAMVVLGMIAAVLLRDPRSAAAPAPPPAPVERVIEEGTVAAMVYRAARRADDRIASDKARILTALFAPVNAAVPAYLDFHYSVIGEYTELSQAAFGTISDGLTDRLYNGFDARLAAGTADIAALWQRAFARELDREISAEIGTGAVVADVTRIVLDDTVDRMRVGLPVMAIAGSAGAAAGGKLAAATIGKAAVKGGMKVAGKGIGKLLAGAGTGAALGAALGPPGMFVGGVIGGIGTWFAVDVLVLTLDEALNRPAFEAELRTAIAAHRGEVARRIDAALAEPVVGAIRTLRDRHDAAR
ncbi:hypothetical protein [Palleronia rufa]|uniref:hypothetical protein n=1 Tax=Palleronia rufa TaxID=1530186 RepID=UPI000568E993|nr:hypothetical protein [Palleronia rufa]